MEINKIYNDDCLDTMAKMPDGSVDLVVTSPPYDNLRTYNGSLEWGEHVWKPVIQELFRVVSEGGVVVWVVGDATIKGSETGTSFRQALYFMSVGFNLHDTMIYKKFAPFHDVKTAKRYRPNFEYMFVFSKGSVQVFNPIEDEKSKITGEVSYQGGNRKKDGNLRSDSREPVEVKEFRCRNNIWSIGAGGNRTGHPAVFPEKLANDHILSWSNEGDLVYDPFMESGTTAKMAIINKRNWIGSEISKEYCDIAEKRINENL